MSRMTGAQALVRSLAIEGVEVIFGFHGASKSAARSTPRWWIEAKKLFYP